MKKGEESPDFSKRRDLKLLQQRSCTPKGKIVALDDLHLLGLHRDCSPNAHDSQDKLEIGWGDSPEPLNIGRKSMLNMTPLTCKKRLEDKESPKSRCRNIRPCVKSQSKQTVDVSKYVAEVQELSKRIMNKGENSSADIGISYKYEKENNSRINELKSEDFEDLLNDDLTDEYIIACCEAVENKLSNHNGNSEVLTIKEYEKQKSPLKVSAESVITHSSDQRLQGSASSSPKSVSSFEKVLKSFKDEEEDKGNQALYSRKAEFETPRKRSFLKTRSENQLSSPDSTLKNDIPLPKRSNGFLVTFRKSYSSERIERRKEKSRVLERNNSVISRTKTEKTIFLSDKAKTDQQYQRKGFG